MSDPVRSTASGVSPHHSPSPQEGASGAVLPPLGFGVHLPPHPGCCLPEGPRRNALHAALGRTLPDEVWELHLTGFRILVAPEPVGERHKGLLWKPRSAVERESLAMGAGWVIAVGPEVGSTPQAPPAGALNCPHPVDILGAKVVFRAYSGANLKTSEEDTEFGGQFSLLVLTDRDILAWRPDL